MDFDEWEKMKEYEEGRGVYQSLYDAMGKTFDKLYEGYDPERYAREEREEKDRKREEREKAKNKEIKERLEKERLRREQELIAENDPKEKELREKAKLTLPAIREHIIKYKMCISASGRTTVGLKMDGTVVAIGDN